MAKDGITQARLSTRGFRALFDGEGVKVLLNDEGTSYAKVQVHENGYHGSLWVRGNHQEFFHSLSFFDLVQLLKAHQE